MDLNWFWDYGNFYLFILVSESLGEMIIKLVIVIIKYRKNLN